MRDALLAQPSAGVKASFPGLLSRARDLTEDLRSWCRSESQRAEGIFVGEVGMDLIAGQRRLVVQSLFDVLSGREI
jgi:hypothetical protein